MEFEVFDLGLVDFLKTWSFQKETFNKVRNNLISSALILCRHYPVITLGRLTDKNNILASEQELKVKGINVYAIERGGDVTYHGPGQLTIYPVFDLNYFGRDIHSFLRFLEEVVIDFLAEFGIYAMRRAGLTGVWLNTEKIASIGISVKNWISFHGLSINVTSDDLDNFRFIRPCGINIKMTSMETLLKEKPSLEILKEIIINKFKSKMRDTHAIKAECVPERFRNVSLGDTLPIGSLGVPVV